MINPRFIGRVEKWIRKIHFITWIFVWNGRDRKELCIYIAEKKIKKQKRVGLKNNPQRIYMKEIKFFVTNLGHYIKGGLEKVYIFYSATILKSVFAILLMCSKWINVFLHFFFFLRFLKNDYSRPIGRSLIVIFKIRIILIITITK